MSMHTVVERLRAYRRYRETVLQLAKLSNAQLRDIGVPRGEIEKRARA